MKLQRMVKQANYSMHNIFLHQALLHVLPKMKTGADVYIFSFLLFNFAMSAQKQFSKDQTISKGLYTWMLVSIYESCSGLSLSNNFL